MIEILNELATQAALKTITVTIQANSASSTSVVLQCIPHPLMDAATEEQQKLRRSLATPIILSGFAPELEAKLDEQLYNFLKTVKPHARSLESQIEGIGDALKGASDPEGSSDNESTGAENEAPNGEEEESTSDNQTDSL